MTVACGDNPSKTNYVVQPYNISIGYGSPVRQIALHTGNTTYRQRMTIQCRPAHTFCAPLAASNAVSCLSVLTPVCHRYPVFLKRLEYRSLRLLF